LLKTRRHGTKLQTIIVPAQLAAGYLFL